LPDHWSIDQLEWTARANQRHDSVQQGGLAESARSELSADQVQARPSLDMDGPAGRDSGAAHTHTQALETALLAFPLPYRTAVVLRDIERFSTREAAHVAGVGKPSFKRRLHQASLDQSVQIEYTYANARARLRAASRLSAGYGPAAPGLDDVMTATHASKSQLHHYFGDGHGSVEAVV
jgi:hypothetical protein